MSCPDWTSLVRRRDEDAAGEALWRRALEHLEGCQRCRQAAYAAEPTLVFRRLPAVAVSEREVDAMKQAVDAMRRAQPLVEPVAARRRFPRRPPAVWLRAAATVAVAAGALTLYSLLGPPSPGGPDALPEAMLGARSPVAQSLHFEIQVLRASRHELSPSGLAENDLAPELREELQTFLRFENYQVLARAGVDSVEGEAVVSPLGDSFEVSFQAGSVVAQRRLRLEGFQIERKAAVKGPRLEPQQLLNAHLNLRLDRPLTLTLAQDPAEEEALVVAITCRLGGGPER